MATAGGPVVDVVDMQAGVRSAAPSAPVSVAVMDLLSDGRRNVCRHRLVTPIHKIGPSGTGMSVIG